MFFLFSGNQSEYCGAACVSVSTLFLLLVHQEMVESSTKYASIVIAEKVEKTRLKRNS